MLRESKIEKKIIRLLLKRENIFFELKRSKQIIK